MRFIATVGTTVARLACRSCGYAGPIRAMLGVRGDKGESAAIARESLERASVRILARRYGKSKNTIMRIVHRVAASLPSSAGVAAMFRPRWSGILVFDGKVARVYDALAAKLDRSSFSDDEIRWLHKRRWLCGVDHGTGDLPHYDLAEAESRVDLVMYFETLKTLGYPLKAVVCDGNPEIPRAARFVFGEGVVIQRCVRHFLEDLRRLLPPRDDPERPELERAVEIIRTVIMAPSIEESAERLGVIRRAARRSRCAVAHQMLALLEGCKEELCAYLIHPRLRLPRTSNDAESLFKQLNLRLRSLGRFFRQRYARDYLNAWALLRRFTPFTDCRGGRRARNGKAPLALAGAEIKNIDPLTLRKQQP